MLDIFEQKQRCQFVDQYSGFAAAGSGRNHDAVGLFVGDDLHLSRGERPEELLVFLGRQVALDLVDAFAAEVFCDETPVVRSKDFLSKYEKVHAFLDNDAPGRGALGKIRSFLPEDVILVNESERLYPRCNDFNEFLQKTGCPAAGHEI